MTYLLISNKSWHQHLPKAITEAVGSTCHLISTKDNFNYEHVKELAPKYIFVTHWSDIIPAKLYENFEIIIFHMTDLPYGRGGSPLQNLIMADKKHTKISAIKCEAGLDTGAIYLKKDLSLQGSAQQIFARATDIMFLMMIEIINTQPTPVAQHGECSIFKRRSPEQSDLFSFSQQHQHIEKIYDFIRMLDCDGYPHAFLQLHDYRLSFRDAELKNNKVKCSVVIERKNEQ